MYVFKEFFQHNVNGSLCRWRIMGLCVYACARVLDEVGPRGSLCADSMMQRCVKRSAVLSHSAHALLQGLPSLTWQAVSDQLAVQTHTHKVQTLTAQIHAVFSS